MKVYGISQEIQLIRRNQKRLTVRVQPDGKVVVRAPLRLPESEIRAFLREKAAVIEQMIEKQLAVTKQSAEAGFFSDAEIQEMAQRACAVIPPRVAYFAERIGVTYGKITIRNQKTRWGSCTSIGNLNFNCLLVLMPPEVLDSVVVHELCHRKHLDHSKAFYEEIYRVFPKGDYDRCQAWLKANGPLLIRRMTG